MVAKALDSQRHPLPLSMGVGKCDIERGRTPEEADDIYLNVAAKIHAIVLECEREGVKASNYGKELEARKKCF